MTHFKVLTSDYRPPLQGGKPIWDGVTLPFTLPSVTLDRSDAECSNGWNYTDDLATALRIAGLWPTGRPSVALMVEPAADGIARGEKRRASSLTLVRQATDDEIADAIHALSAPFGEHQDTMAAEQVAWRMALRRPRRDEEAVVAGLTAALAARSLPWTLAKFDSARAARAAWDAWDAWAAWDAWDARAAWDARDAWAARDALTWQFAGRMGWVPKPDLLTTGLRDAYATGLAIAIPTGPSRLGWAMEGTS